MWDKPPYLRDLSEFDKLELAKGIQFLFLDPKILTIKT